MYKKLVGILIIFFLFLFSIKTKAYIVFRKNGDIINLQNSIDNEKNLIVFLNNGSIKVLSTPAQNKDLQAFVPSNRQDSVILGSDNDVSSQELIKPDGELRISRNSDESVTLTVVDQKNPDVVFEHKSKADQSSDRTLVYLDIEPAPITISDEIDGLYITQDIFKIKLNNDFSSFIIRSTPNNISITTDSKEFAMMTQPIDAGRILAEEDKSFSTRFLQLQELVFNGREPEYRLYNERTAAKILSYNFSCEKTYSVLFTKKELSEIKVPFFSRLFCLIPAK